MRTKYHIIRSSKELKQLISACRKTGYACVDFETNAESLYNEDFSPTILSVSFMPGFGCSIPLDHFETSSYTEPGWNWKKSLRVFGERVIENRDVVKVAWNAKFDFQIFEKYHIYYRGTLLDGMLAKYLLNEERPNDLKSMVSRYIPEAAGYESDKGFDRIPWDQKPLDKLCQYGCQDTDYTLRLTLFFENKLIKLNMYALYRNLVMPSSRVLQAVEKNGLYLDRGFNQTLLAEYQPKIDRAIENINNLPQVRRYQAIYNRERIDKYIEKIEEEISSLDPDNPKELSKIKSREKLLTNVKAGVYTNNTQRDLIKPLNFKSNVDLPALMYSEEGLGFSPIKKTDKGKPSTDEETLVELRMKVEKPESPKAIFLDNLLQLRGLEKMYKTYILGWSEKVQDDNCLHGKFNIIGCVSGNTPLVGKTGRIRIKDICPEKPGHKNIEDKDIWVLSHEGTWEKVTHTLNKGKQKMYKVTTSEGDVIRCTAEHKFLTTSGWKRASSVFKKNLTLIMYDTEKLDITRPNTGKAPEEVIFRDIPGWDGYLATNEGKIYSVKTPGGHGLDYNHPHELVPRQWKPGYERVYFRRGGKKKYAFAVSHLIYQAFMGPIPEGYVIDHINCNTLDNRPENLQCITTSQNISRAYKYTRSSYTDGMRNGTTKFSNLVIGKVLEGYKLGKSQRELMSEFNMSQKQVSGIVNRQRRKDIYLAKIVSMEYIGEKTVYDLSVNDKHSYVTHSNFINSNTTSGRLSSSEPNLQQIPKTSVDPNIKKQLIARPGTLYMAMDFSQAELRIMAHLSGDETYLKAFREGQDPHLAIAAKKYHTNYEEASAIYENDEHPEHKIWKIRRKQAKQIAFGIIYGIQAKLLSQKLSDVKAGLIVTPEEAQQQLDDFFEEHPKIKKFMKKQEKLLRKQGYISSLFGRKRRLPQVYSDDSSEAAYAVRLSVNMPCQSAASDMCLFGSILLYWLMRQGKLPMMESVTLVHDANYFNPRPQDINLWVVYQMWNIYRNPSTKKYFGFSIDDVDMSMDFSIGRSMAEELPFIPGYDYTKMLQPDFSVEAYMEEHKKFKGVEIKDYPKIFKKEFKAYEKNYTTHK